MSIEAMKKVIEKLRTAMTDARQNESHFESWMILNEAICDSIDDLRQAIEQAQQDVDWEKLYRLEVKKKEAIAAKYEQDIKPLTKIVPMAQQVEPVLWAGVDFDIKTSPPSRQWVGLTDEEIGLLTTGDKWSHVETPLLALFARAIEAKLKEKNT